jgi:hypothetical protein
MINSNDTIGYGTRDLSVCSAVPELTAPLRAPLPTARIVVTTLKQTKRHVQTMDGGLYTHSSGSSRVTVEFYCLSLK